MAVPRPCWGDKPAAAAQPRRAAAESESCVESVRGGVPTAPRHAGSTAQAQRSEEAPAFYEVEVRVTGTSQARSTARISIAKV